MPSLFTELVAPLAAGLAMFLFGMKVIEFALFQWTGAYMKTTLTQLTRSPLRGLIVGTGTTALLQSSSAVTVMTIGLVNAGVLTFPQTLGIILGTNIGSCLTTELIGFRITDNMMPALLVSASCWIASLAVPPMRSQAANRAINAVRGLSLSLAGFSCLVLALEIMQTIVPFLQERGLLAWFIDKARASFLWGIVAGACLTALIHSSAASIAIAMGFASLGLLPVDLGIAVILGSNIGTCATALIAAVGGSRYGQYVAWSHLLLNVGGTILFYPLIVPLEQLVAVLASDPASQLAHAQTLFNIVCSLLALPLCYLPALKRIQA